MMPGVQHYNGFYLENKIIQNNS